MTSCGSIRDVIVIALLCAVMPVVVAAAPASDAPQPRSAVAELVDRAEALLDSGKPQDAYRLLDAELVAHAGKPRFDYILALAALQAGKPEAALLPLRRVVAADPGFSAARFELGDLLAQFEDSEGARAQFEAILDQRPNPTLRTLVERRLDALPLPGRLGRLRISLDSQLGYDTNVNGASTDDSFQGIVLDPRFKATESPYMNLQIGARREHRASDRVSTRLSATVGHRANTDASYLDQSWVGARGSVTVRIRSAQLTAGVDVHTDWLDGTDHRRGAGVELGLAVSPWPRWELAGVVRTAVLQYDPLPLRLLDVDRVFGGVVLSRSGIGRVQARVGVAALGGQDRVRRTGSSYSNDRYGGRVFATLEPTPRLRASIEAAYLVADFFDGGGFFGIDRLDRTRAAAVSIQWRSRPVGGWTLGPQVIYTRNESNITLFRYERVETAFYVRYEFR